MSSGATAVLGAGQQNAGNQGVDYGGVSGLLSKMDPLGNKITEVGGDPLNIYGHNNNPNALLFPSGNPNGTGGAPSVLPNLGPQSLIPQAPRGGFMPVQTGGGFFNAEANRGAGQLFDPAMIRRPPPPHMQTPSSMMTSQLSPQMAALIQRFLGPRIGDQNIGADKLGSGGVGSNPYNPGPRNNSFDLYGYTV